jgi:transposase
VKPNGIAGVAGADRRRLGRQARRPPSTTEPRTRPCRSASTAVAIEATTGWRWVWRELTGLGFEVRLVDPAQAKALRGRVRRVKTDRLDARRLCLLLAKEMLPESWLPPAEIQTLRDQTRLRKALAEDRTRWAQRLHALLTHRGGRASGRGC